MNPVKTPESAAFGDKAAPLVPVLFRVWPKANNQVIAIFPTLPGDYNPATCLSFMHVGQHGSCDPAGLIRETRPAKWAEYKHLHDELTTAPYSYRLDVKTRLLRGYFQERCDALKQVGA